MDIRPGMSFEELPQDLQELILRNQKKHHLALEYQKKRFGNAPPIISAVINGKRLVTINGQMYESENPKEDWTLPADFLIASLRSFLGGQWLDNEFKKAFDEQHEIAKWYSRGSPRLFEGEKWDSPNGKGLALLHLAYDIYVLENVGRIPNRIIERLKNPLGFNGARYEVFVFATMIRAGFDLEYLDEASGQNSRVTECVATHNLSKEKVYVEAKTRDVRGVLGAPSGNRKKIRLYAKIRDAIEKNPDGPYFVFVDANLPEITEDKRRIEYGKIHGEYEKAMHKYKGSMPNLVCVTNIPFHYGEDHAASPSSALIGLNIATDPKYRLASEHFLIKAVDDSLQQYAFVPKDFEEADKHAESLINKEKT